MDGEGGEVNEERSCGSPELGLLRLNEQLLGSKTPRLHLEPPLAFHPEQDLAYTPSWRAQSLPCSRTSGFCHHVGFCVTVTLETQASNPELSVTKRGQEG